MFVIFLLLLFFACNQVRMESINGNLLTYLLNTCSSAFPATQVLF